MRGVAQASEAHPEPIAFDYLSRLERGHIMPSVPKLSTLAAVYGRPLSEIMDLYEVEQFRSLVPRKGTYALFRKLGLENLEKGLVLKAMACFLGSIDAARREGADGKTLATGYLNSAGAMIRAGRYFMARQYLEEGLRLTDDVPTRVRLLNNLANVHYNIDNLAVADLFSREASALAGNDEALVSTTSAIRSAILLDLKRFAEAEPLMRGVVESARRTGNESIEIRWLFNLGYCLVEQGKISEGLGHLRDASARAAERGDPELRAKSLYFLGRCFYVAGRKDEAASPLKSSLLIARDNDFRNEAFRSAFYLWKLARESGARAEETDYLSIASAYRARLEQRSEEATEFDEIVGKPARRRESSGRRASRAVLRSGA